MKSLIRTLLAFAVVAGSAAVAVGTRAAAPPNRYTVVSGTVRDNKTKLTWQQTAPSTTLAQTDAASYCSGLSLNGTGWRLPTLFELETLLDYSVAPPGPMIDATFFFNTAQLPYWTSSPSVGASVVAYVGFSNGNAGYFNGTDTSPSVRCVR
jgi:hypothetical protein